MRPVFFFGFFLFGGFALHHLTADNQIPQQRQFNFRRHFKREGEHVGRFIHAAVSQVQLVAFRFIHQADGNFTLFLKHRQHAVNPALKLSFRGQVVCVFTGDL